MNAFTAAMRQDPPAAMRQDPPAATQPGAPAVPRLVLHVGCGVAHPGKLPEDWFPRHLWQEVRLDIDPTVAPDVVASITDMGILRPGIFDAVWSSHNLEHLYPHEVPRALAEFRRVLKPDGFLLATLPDLQQVAALVAEDRLTDPAYLSAAGPITPLDMLYGLGTALAQGNGFMGPRGGFTATSLRSALDAAGFPRVLVARDGRFGLWATAHMAAAPATAPATLADLVA
jgi:SAM-dependent methyltransferase